MYESLKAWCKQEVTLYREGVLLPSGEHDVGTTFTVKGLLVDDSKQIVDKNGQLIVCKSYVYIIPTTKVEETDLVILPGDTNRYTIRKLSGYYDGNTGDLSIQVIYL